MTFREAAAWLNRGLRIRARLDDQTRRIQKWRAMATNITAVLKDVPSAPSMPSKKIENCAVNIADAEAEIAEQIWALTVIESEISAALRKLDDPIYEEILTKHYLLGDTWDSIAGSMNYSLRWIMHLKNEAIKQIAHINSH